MTRRQGLTQPDLSAHHRGRLRVSVPPPIGYERKQCPECDVICELGDERERADRGEPPADQSEVHNTDREPSGRTPDSRTVTGERARQHLTAGE